MGGCELYDLLGRKTGRVEELFAGEDDRPKRVRAKVGALQGRDDRTDTGFRAVAVERPRSVVMLR
jgi:hypothetical protein